MPRTTDGLSGNYYSLLPILKLLADITLMIDFTVHYARTDVVQLQAE
jgi:hypothetical protein